MENFGGPAGTWGSAARGCGKLRSSFRLVNGRQYRLDVFVDRVFVDRRQVVVRERSHKRKWKRWSLFELKAPRGKGLSKWHEVYYGGVDLGRFAALLLKPKVAAKLRRLLD